MKGKEMTEDNRWEKLQKAYTPAAPNRPKPEKIQEANTPAKAIRPNKPKEEEK